MPCNNIKGAVRLRCNKIFMIELGDDLPGLALALVIYVGRRWNLKIPDICKAK